MSGVGYQISKRSKTCASCLSQSSLRAQRFNDIEQIKPKIKPLRSLRAQATNGSGRDKEKDLFEKNKIIANPNIVLREEFENHAFLYDPDTGDTFPLNPVGAFIWEHLDGRHTVGQILEMMSINFENVPDSALDHIMTFFKDLSEKGFIKR